jgi:hypothetical protein
LIATLTIDTSSWTTAKPRLVATSVQRRASTLALGERVCVTSDTEISR